MRRPRYRVAIRSLKQPKDSLPVVVASSLSQNEALSTLKRFTKLKWELRRPFVYTIDHIALVVELEKTS